ncbi:hypothetical protein KEJ47_02170 [Candidatus Bathyarchaeota archaeon]|nr:hypothetical protein [Candidatus Bathyarchaeota archaeon]
MANNFGETDHKGKTMIDVPKVDLEVTGLRVSRLGFGPFDFGDPFPHIRAEEGG